MINVPYVDKKNIEFIGILFRTFRTFSKIEQHKTISLGSPIIDTSSHRRMYAFLLSYVRHAKNIRTSPKKLTYDNDSCGLIPSRKNQPYVTAVVSATRYVISI